MYISFLLLLFAYVHVICILSEHMHIMRTLSAVVFDIFLPNRQCRCHPYVISSTLYISYHVQLSFRTLSAQMHIVHVICMLSPHVHIICLSSLPLLIYLIIQNLVSAHCLHTCIFVNVICILFRNVYVMYMSSLLLLSVYVHVIYILSGHICIMCTLSEVVLDIFLPNRQYQCHPYIISSSLYIFLSWRICYTHPFWMTCHLHPFRMTCHLHPFWMMCHPHPFRMTCHLHSKETCLTSLKSEKQVTGKPDN